METSTHRKKRMFGVIQEHDQTTGCYRHKHKQGCHRAHNNNRLGSHSGRRDKQAVQGRKNLSPEARPPMPWKWIERGDHLWSASNAGNRGTWPEIAGSRLDLRAMNYEQIMAYAKGQDDRRGQEGFFPTRASEDSPTSLSEQV